MTATATPKQSLFGALHTLADEIQAEKTAAARGQVKQGAPTPADPGGYQGPSTHPTTDVDNNVQTATEGARSSENKADVKADQGSPGVDSTSEATPNQDEQDSVQLNIGTQQSATGEDPSVEDDYKGDKDDPGTSHPATTEDGEKYSSCSFKEAHVKATGLANEILADLANGFGVQLTPGGPVQKQAAAPAKGQESSPQQATPQGQPTMAEKIASTKQAGTSTTDQQIQAGYELAAAIGIEKSAAQAAVQGTIDQTIRDAHIDAELFGGYYTQFQKRAAEDLDDQEGGEDHSDPGDEASGASDAPSDGGGGGEAGGGMAGLEGLLGAGGGEPMPELGGEALPPEGGGDLGGEPSEEEVLMELAAAMEELGVSPEELAQVAAEGGGMGGGMGGEMGGGEMGGGAPPPAAEPEPAEGLKLAQAVQRFKRSGKYQIKEASTKRARHIRDVMKSHVLELLGRQS